MEDVYSLAKNFYLNVDQAKVIISGDGASWIRECHKYWPGSVYVIDKFHAIRKIRNVYSSNAANLQPTYQVLKTLFNQGNYHKNMNILKKIIEEKVLLLLMLSPVKCH